MNLRIALIVACAATVPTVGGEPPEAPRRMAHWVILEPGEPGELPWFGRLNDEGR